MFRVDSEDSVASIPTPEAAGTPGYYGKGDPGLGIQATVVPFDHLNAIQESIIHPIEARGVSLSKSAPYDKLTEAIQSFVAESGNVSGLMLSRVSNTLSFLGANGNALSSSNFGFVPVKSVTTGKKIALKMATPIDIESSLTAGDLEDITFGINGAADWGELPLFIYAINKGDNPIADTNGQSAIAFSRNPWMHITPAATYIGKKSTVPGTASPRNVILWGDNYTTSAYEDLPCTLIGAWVGSWGTTFDSWAFTYIGDDFIGGLGRDVLDRFFTRRWVIPVSQGGANTSSHFATAGTVPTWATPENIESYYYLNRGSGIRCVGTTRGAGNVTNGSGGQVLALQIPYLAIGEVVNGSRYLPMGWRRLGTTESVMLGSIQENNTNINMHLDSGSAVTNTSFTNSADDVSWDFTYNPF